MISDLEGVQSLGAAQGGESLVWPEEVLGRELGVCIGFTAARDSISRSGTTIQKRVLSSGWRD